MVIDDSIITNYKNDDNNNFRNVVYNGDFNFNCILLRLWWIDYDYKFPLRVSYSQWRR